MARFRYKAVADSGELVDGVMEGPDRNAIVTHLREHKQMPLVVEPFTENAIKEEMPPNRLFSWSRRNVSGQEVTLFVRELQTMLNAGVALDRSLGLIVDAGASPPMRAVLSRIQANVRNGQPFSDALAEHGEYFDRFFCAMVRAGEEGGTLDQALGRLADYRERSESLVATVRTALIYPAILLVAAIVSVTIIMTVVVPEFRTIFSEFAADLPWGTRLLLGTSEFLSAYGWVVALLALLLVIAVRRADLIRRNDAIWLRLPVVGTLLAEMSVERFVRALSALLANGVPVADALGLCAGVAKNSVFAAAIATAETRIKAGVTLADAFAASPHFPPMALQLMRVGEESGLLQPTLQKLADSMGAKVEMSLKRLVAVVEPGLIIFAGLLVAGIVVSLVGAILSINTHVL